MWFGFVGGMTDAETETTMAALAELVSAHSYDGDVDGACWVRGRNDDGHESQPTVTLE